ncbi:MAG: radical SAM protein [Desulfobacterales bacterium]
MEKAVKKPPCLITAVVSNKEGKIFELPGYAAVGMEGRSLLPLKLNETIHTPFGSELMFLPDRKPILFNICTDSYEILTENPQMPGEAIFPVAVFNSPGYVLSCVSAYQEKKNAGYLPLFSYGAVGWHKGCFRSAAIRIDRERRQDLRLMNKDKMIVGIKNMRKKMPKNRLRMHLETCALTYGCPAGKNFFLKRYEAPLPTSESCNARCLGCISSQKTGDIPTSQERISFRPSPEEIAEVALEHIQNVHKGIVSFGQGCEGDPLLSADAIEPAIRSIRSKTKKGTININTNGSRPDILKQLFSAGLDSVRISMNSVRKKCYHAYFRPNGYTFSDVTESIAVAGREKKFISINYLNTPGFTDTPEEIEALLAFIKRHEINMIQWRNLNFDPVRYLKIMGGVSKQGKPIGIKNLFDLVKKSFPGLKNGYFNPPKEKFTLL